MRLSLVFPPFLAVQVAERGFAFERERDVTLKGFSGQHRVAAVVWR